MQLVRVEASMSLLNQATEVLLQRTTAHGKLLMPPKPN